MTEIKHTKTADRVHAKVIQVIEIEVRRGEGTEDSTYRRVMQYYSLNGKLLAEYDPCAHIENKS